MTNEKRYMTCDTLCTLNDKPYMNDGLEWEMRNETWEMTNYKR